MAANRPLDGKVAIVTGASSGLGWAIAKSLAAAGAKVSLAARRLDKLQMLKSEVEELGGVAICIATDVSKKEDVKQLLKSTTDMLGGVDILVNNAGIMHIQNMSKGQLDSWDQQVDVNCKGVMYCIGEVLPGMLERKSGHIVNMSSDAGRKGFEDLAVYSGTKFFVEGLSQALRKEVCGSGVRVTCVQPGDVATELASHAVDHEANSKYFDAIKDCKILEPSDIAAAVLYAVTQPEHCAVNEILVEPRECPI